MKSAIETILHRRAAVVVVSIFLLTLFLNHRSIAQPAQVGSASIPPAVEIAGTQTLHLNSSITGEEFNLYINLPREYQDTSKLLPVIYLLDGQWDFPLLNAIFGEQYYDGFIPGAIVVGIAWGGANPNYDTLRARDLTPTATKQTPFGGNAPKFLQFIKTEVIPFIDARYRTKKDDRTLMGSSLGGLFTLDALFQETSLFNRYVLTSPAIGWDDGVVESYEKNYAPKGGPIKLFMAVGGLEGNESAFEKFAARLKEKKLEGLEIETRVIQGIGHSGGKAEGYTRGLQFVFAKPSVMVDAAILDQYVGTYKINAEITVKMIRDENQLVVLPPDGSRISFAAESQTDFHVKGEYLIVHFKKDDKGKVTGFELEQYGGRQFIPKTD